jgi:hypothetical protein
MKDILERLQSIRWSDVQEILYEKGYAMLPKVLNEAECAGLIENYNSENSYRKTVNMERYRFGAGEYKYFIYPLPALIETIRQAVYPFLAPVANRWMTDLGIDRIYPMSHGELKDLCEKAGQTKPTVLILKYERGGFNTLHQDLYGDLFFPMQLVLFLNEPGQDYSGGEFVLTEAFPRAQTKANVLQPKKGEMLIFTTNFRPAKGRRSFYKVNMKHGVSPVHDGSRHTLGIIFHDAIT